jgi:predicted PhzF superfamily epimerase YddE/YHI9
MAYLWSREGEELLVRFFFTQHGAVIEDPATGSACANLGGWFCALRPGARIERVVSQGEAVARPSTLRLAVREGSIFVGGRVLELGRGTLEA